MVLSWENFDFIVCNFAREKETALVCEYGFAVIMLRKSEKKYFFQLIYIVILEGGKEA